MGHSESDPQSRAPPRPLWSPSLRPGQCLDRHLHGHRQHLHQDCHDAGQWREQEEVNENYVQCTHSTSTQADFFWKIACIPCFSNCRLSKFISVSVTLYDRQFLVIMYEIQFFPE